MQTLFSLISTEGTKCRARYIRRILFVTSDSIFHKKQIRLMKKLEDIFKNAKRAILTLLAFLVFVLTTGAQTVAELKAENELLKTRMDINLLSLCVIICVIMIFFMWGIKERHRKHLLMLERKNRAMQRTNDLLNEAKKIVEHQSRMKTIYTNNLAHEIRTPLNQIYGFAQILEAIEKPMPAEDSKEIIKAINDACRQLTNIVENIDKVSAELDKLETLSDVETVLKAKQ